MEKDNKSFKDLPAHLRYSYKPYKIHGEVVSEFTRTHGVKIDSGRDWDYAPYMVRERLKGQKPPDEVKDSLDIVIKDRVLTIDEYEARRKAARKKITPGGLSHLIFIDKFRHMQRAWFSEDVPTNASNKRRNTGARVQPDSPLPSDWTDFASSNGQARMNSTSGASENGRSPSSESNSSRPASRYASEKDQEKESGARDTWGGINQAALLHVDLGRPQLDLAEANSVQSSPAPGTFVFEVNTVRRFVKRYHPYHTRPLWWSHDTAVEDLKKELRRCTVNRWPVSVVIEDCYGRHTLELDEVFDFAHDTKRHTYSDSDSMITGEPIKFPVLHGSK